MSDGAPTLVAVLEVPRSARLAAWGTAALRGECAWTDAVRAVVRDDEPHTVDTEQVQGAVLPSEGSDGVFRLLRFLHHSAADTLRVVLPAPGDVLGLPGPPAFNEEAAVAGECVLVDFGPRTPGYGLVPTIEAFGSAYEVGHLVTWTLTHTNPLRVTDVGSLAEADRALKEALGEAIETLATLDVARWREDAADRIAAVREGVLAPNSLPRGAPPRAVQVLSSAARIRAIVALAVEDDGAAISGHEAQRRAQALRGLDAVARRGIVAAVNAVHEPVRRRRPSMKDEVD